MIFVDESGRHLPKGTVIDLQPYSPHAGLIGYNAWGQQVVAHNSKKHTQAVVTWPQDFNDGHIPFRIVRYPGSVQEGERIWQSAIMDVERGVPWLPGDNCQDFVSRAVTGHNGSPTRDAVVGLGIFGALLWIAASI
jgi:hypothetical protein